MQRISPELVRSASAKVDEAIKTDKERKDAIQDAHINDTDREFVRAELVDIADRIRRKYNLTIPVVRSFLHEMLDVSV